MRKILQRFLATAAVLLLATGGFAGTTSVTATVTDPNGAVYANASVVADFIPVPGLAGPYTVSGTAFSQHVTSTANAGGAFSMTLTDNATVQPVGSKWRLTVCSVTNNPCFQYVSAITGAAVSLSSALSAAAPAIAVAPLAIPRADLDAQVETAFGIFYNNTTGKYRVWNGSAWEDVGVGAGTVTNVTGTAPIVSSGGATPAISIPKSTAAVDGYLAAADFSTFNTKPAINATANTIPKKSGANLVDSSCVDDGATVTCSEPINTSGAGGPDTFTAIADPTCNVAGYFWYSSTTSNRFKECDGAATHVFVYVDSTDSLTNKTLVTPTIASFTNATHDHSNAAGGGQIGATGISNNAVSSTQMAVVNTRRSCDLAFGDTSGSALTNAQLGPQKNPCFVPAAATVVEIDIEADAGTPNIIMGRVTAGAGSATNLTSSALATAAAGARACSKTGATTCIDGTTTASATLQNTSVAAGDTIGAVSGTAGGTAKFVTVHVIYTIN